MNKIGMASLQPLRFRLHSRPMRKVIRAIILSCFVALTATVTHASELQRGPQDSSFLERYTSAAQDVILQGLKLVGVRYRLGGSDADKGLDCSGFVQVVYKDSIGALLPRTAREMSEVGQKIDPSQLKPGDLVFFNTMRRAFSHVGIYLGDNHFLHAPRAGAEVRVESMENSYWTQRYNGARRIIEGN